MKSEIRALAEAMVPQARKYLVDRPGVYEVHTSDGEFIEIGVTPLWRFISDWELQGHFAYDADAHRKQFIGIVGDGCAVLCPLETIAAGAAA